MRPDLVRFAVTAQIKYGWLSCKSSETDQVELSTLIAQSGVKPGDLGRLLVLQDALLEQKDPRGELMVLQFKQARHEDTAADRTRITQLLRTHLQHLLGALQGHVDPGSLVFEYGFLTQAKFLPSAFAPSARAKWFAEPALRLLQELGVPRTASPGEVLETLRADELAGLPGVSIEDPALFDRLARAPRPWPFERVGVVGTGAAVLKQLEVMDKNPALASVTHLVVHLGRFGRTALLELSKGLSKFKFVSRLTTIEVRTDSNDYGAFGFGVSTLAKLAPAILHGQHVRVRLNAGQVEMRGSTGPSPLCTVIEGLSGPITSLRAVQTDTRSPVDGELDSLKNHLRRLKPKTLDLPSAWGLVD